MGEKSHPKRNTEPEQLTFGAPMGIRRKGGGRKKSKDSGVSHLKREWGSKHVPLHATAKLADDLPSLRTRPCFRVIEKAFRAGRERPGRREDGEFRLIEYSIQEDHLHVALARGMAGLLVRIAKGLNRLLARQGKVWKERFHSRLLRTPREVRNALRYIFANARKHGLRLVRGVPDVFSLAVWFEGWCDYDHRYDPNVMRTPPTAEPRTWLRRVGWRRHGLLAVP